MTGLAFVDAFKQKTVMLLEKYLAEDLLPEYGLYPYLYRPGEQHGDQKKRATDLNWSKGTF